MVAGLLNRMADGDAAACTLEEARSRLLLGPVPRGLNSRVELARRLQKWSDGAFMELLERAEEQCRQRANIRAALRRAPKHGDRARRARSPMGKVHTAKPRALSTLRLPISTMKLKHNGARPSYPAAQGLQMSPCRTQGLRLERRPLQWPLSPFPTRILGQDATVLLQR